MQHRISVAVMLALALSGCQTPGATGGKVAIQAKMTKVQAMTKTFSLSKNQGLNKATQSFQALATSLSGAFSSTSSAVAGGNRQYSVEEMITTLRGAGMRASYKVSGVADYGDSQVEYDDESGEVKAIRGKDAEIEFDFVNNGSTRQWTATIKKSPDGTTGKFSVDVTGTWRSISSPAPMSLAYALRQVADESDADAEAEATSSTATGDEEMETTAAPSSGSTGTSSAGPRYKWFNNEYPETVEAVKVSLEVTPKGDKSLAIAMSGSFDQPQAVPNNTLKVPTHWKYKVSVPKVSFDWDSKLNLAAGKSTLNASGTMNVEGDQGKEQFTYKANVSEQARSGSFTMTNVGAKVTLSISGSQKDPSRSPDIKSVLLSAEDGSKLGDVALDPKRPRFAIITFTDGSKMDWELYPESLFMVPPPPPRQQG